MKKNIVIVMMFVLLSLTGCSFLLDLDEDFSISGELPKALKFRGYTTFLKAVENIEEENYLVIDQVAEMDPEQVKTIYASSSFGRIDVIKEKRDTVRIHYFAILEKNTLEPIVDINKGSDFEFEVNWSGYKGKAKAMMVIELPEDYKNSLDIDSASGDIYLDDLTLKSLDIDSISGDIAQGNLKTDDLYIESISGDIELGEIVSRKIRIDSIAGDISFSIDEQMGDIEISNISGDVNLKIKGDMNTTFDIDTTAGDIECDYTFDEIEIKDDDILKATMNQGRYKLMIETVAGDITLE